MYILKDYGPLIVNEWCVYKVYGDLRQSMTPINVQFLNHLGKKCNKYKIYDKIFLYLDIANHEKL